MLGRCQVCSVALFYAGAHCDYCNPIDYETFQPRLEALLVRHQEDVDRTAALEKRVANIVRQYTIQV